MKREACEGCNCGEGFLMSMIDSGPVSAAVAGNGAPLGQILVERGLISEEQLAYALAEGQRTGEPIGVVIVRLGFAHSATIAQALATQAGGPTKSEYGYASRVRACRPKCSGACRAAGLPRAGAGVAAGGTGTRVCGPGGAGH